MKFSQVRNRFDLLQYFAHLEVREKEAQFAAAVLDKDKRRIGKSLANRVRKRMCTHTGATLKTAPDIRRMGIRTIVWCPVCKLTATTIPLPPGWEER